MHINFFAFWRMTMFLELYWNCPVSKKANSNNIHTTLHNSNKPPTTFSVSKRRNQLESTFEYGRVALYTFVQQESQRLNRWTATMGIIGVLFLFRETPCVNLKFSICFAKKMCKWWNSSFLSLFSTNVIFRECASLWYRFLLVRQKRKLSPREIVFCAQIAILKEIFPI